MGLQAILEKIRASGAAQIQEIEQNTQSQVRAVLAQAQMEAHQIGEDACATASVPAVAERARILHRARLESLHIVGDVREDLVDTAITRLRERLASVRNTSSYPTVLRMVIREALAELASEGTDKAKLMADPRDRVLLEEILADLKLKVTVSYEINCWGGVMAKSEDGRVVVINTFESRLEHATPFLRRYLAALFEEEPSAVKDVIHA